MLEELFSGKPLDDCIRAFCKNPTTKNMELLLDPNIQSQFNITYDLLAEKLADEQLILSGLNDYDQVDDIFDTRSTSEFERFYRNKFHMKCILNTEEVYKNDDYELYESQLLFKKIQHLKALSSVGNENYVKLLMNDFILCYTDEIANEVEKESNDYYFRMSSFNYWADEVRKYYHNNEKFSKYVKLVNINLSNFLSQETN